MQTRPTLLALLLLAPLATLAGPVYKWTDADGVVHYSDQPQPGAEKVDIGTVQSLNMPVPKGSSAPAPKAEQKKPAPGLGYTEITVSSPPAGKTYIEEPVPVSLVLVPGLLPGHTITWYLNDSPLEETGDAFTLERLDRGAYTLYATITDPASGDSVSTKTVPFYVRQPSELAPHNGKH